MPAGYRELDTASVGPVVADLPDVRARLGGTLADWRVREISDGNMNAVFRVDGPAGGVVVKQALPYIRVIGTGWPFPVSRIEHEHRALLEQARHAPGRVPAVHAWVPELATLVIELLEPHVVMRHGLVAGTTWPGFAAGLGDFLARSLFHTSDFALDTPAKQALAASFAGNAVLCETTADVVFTGPYTGAPLNRVTPGLEAFADRLRGDAALVLAAAEMRHAFATRGEALVHGDLHTGSIMLTAGSATEDVRVIDPEWAFHGPMGFDVGALLGNLLLARFAQPGHADRADGGDDRVACGEWLLESVVAVWDAFADGFRALCRDAGTGLHRTAPLVADAFVERRLAAVFADATGFAGAKMIRRIIGISHVEDFERIGDVARRAACERRALTAARAMLLERGRFAGPADLVALARDCAVRGDGAPA